MLCIIFLLLVIARILLIWRESKTIKCKYSYTIGIYDGLSAASLFYLFLLTFIEWVIN